VATYVLVLEITRNTYIDVGKWKDIPFKNGLYLYIGSAKRGLQKRIDRHCSFNKKFHWHIDYILSHENTSLIEVWTKEKDEECAVASTISKLPETEIVRKGIGSSDCRCQTHLFFFKGSLSRLEDYLRKEAFSHYKP